MGFHCFGGVNPNKANSGFLATALCWAPAFGITPPGAVSTYAPQVTNPDTATLFNLAMSFSSWPHPKNGPSAAYNTSYATIGPLIYPNLSPTCLPSDNTKKGHQS